MNDQDQRPVYMDPIIRSKNHPSLNIQNRKIFVLSANNLSYASR